MTRLVRPDERWLVDWTGDGSFSHPLADVSADVVEYHLDYGTTLNADPGRFRFGPASGTLRLFNRDLKYDPYQDGSVLGDLVLRQTTVRLLFAGQIEFEGRLIPASGRQLTVLGNIDFGLASTNRYVETRLDYRQTEPVDEDGLLGMIRSHADPFEAEDWSQRIEELTVAPHGYRGNLSQWINDAAAYSAGWAYETARGRVGLISRSVAAGLPADSGVETVPDRVDRPTLLAEGETVLRGSWNEPYDGGDPIVRYEGEIGQTPDSVVEFSTTVRQRQFRDLLPGVTYLMRVRAVNSHGDGAWSEWAEATTVQAYAEPLTPPGFVSALTVTVFDNSVPRPSDPPQVDFSGPADGPWCLITWQPPAGAVTDYPVTVQQDPDNDGLIRSYTALAGRLIVNRLPFADDSFDGTMEAGVSARNGTGTGPADSRRFVVSRRGIEPACDLTAPAVTVSATTRTGASLSWTAVAVGGDCPDPVIGYNIYYRIGSRGAEQQQFSRETSAALTGLSEGTTYTVNVAARTRGERLGPRSATVQFTTGTEDQPDPDTPCVSTITAALAAPVIRPQADDVGVTSATIRWNPPTVGDPDAYRIRWRPGRSGDWTVEPAVEATSDSLGGLAADSLYQVQFAQRVTDLCPPPTEYWSEYSPTAEFTTQARPAEETFAAPDAPTVTVTSARRALRVAWVAGYDGGRPVTAWRVEWRPGTSGPWSGSNHAVAVRGRIITSLTDGTAYQIRVRAVNSVGDGAWATVSESTLPASGPGPDPEPTFPPSAPTNLVLTVVGTTIVASWDEPATPNGTIIGYRVVTERSGASSTSRVVDGQQRSHIIDPAPAGSSWNVQVSARNDQDDDYGPAVSANQMVPAVAPPPEEEAKPPSAVSSLEAETLSTSQIRLRWSPASVTDVSPAVTSHDVEYRISGLLGWQQAAATDGDRFVKTIAGLQHSSIYLLRVRAVNSVGAGPWTTVTSSTLAPQILVPRAATVALTNTYISIPTEGDVPLGIPLQNWQITPPARSAVRPVDSYDFALSRGGITGRTSVTELAGVLESGYALRNTVTVAARNITGSGPSHSSTAISYRPPATPPNFRVHKPQAVGTTYVASWSAPPQTELPVTYSLFTFRQPPSRGLITALALVATAGFGALFAVSTVSFISVGGTAVGGLTNLLAFTGFYSLGTLQAGTLLLTGATMWSVGATIAAGTVAGGVFLTGAVADGLRDIQQIRDNATWENTYSSAGSYTITDAPEVVDNRYWYLMCWNPIGPSTISRVAHTIGDG